MTFSRIYELSGVSRLPVDPVEIARALGIKVVEYKAAAELFEVKLYDLYAHCPLGFSFKADGLLCIALNENACGEQRRRFTVAHELAHCVLDHLDHLENRAFSKRQEREAEQFAANLLAPLVVLRECGVDSAPEIARLCGISRKAAELRLERLAERNARGAYVSEDEHRTAEMFRGFTESYAALSKRGKNDRG